MNKLPISVRYTSFLVIPFSNKATKVYLLNKTWLDANA